MLPLSASVQTSLRLIKITKLTNYAAARCTLRAGSTNETDRAGVTTFCWIVAPSSAQASTHGRPPRTETAVIAEDVVVDRAPEKTRILACETSCGRANDSSITDELQE
jgi:hypothetical protein